MNDNENNEITNFQKEEGNVKEKESFFFSENAELEGTPGKWYTGEKIDNVLENSFPILFVHGINRSSTTWRVDNDMAEVTAKNRIETAYIDLHPADDMWKNGRLLAEKLKDIYQYFNEKVVVVAHSKGGIDTQAALVHYGASPYVSRVLTLSSPHHGSELADLAYSKWAGWLTDALKSKSKAVFSLQTAYMRAFRFLTDEDKNGNDTPVYTFGGTGWGSMNSELFWGGLYLSRFGQSDGAVTVKSSRLPYGNEVAVKDWSHKTIKEGKYIFPLCKKIRHGGG